MSCKRDTGHGEKRLGRRSWSAGKRSVKLFPEKGDRTSTAEGGKGINHTEFPNGMEAGRRRGWARQRGCPGEKRLKESLLESGCCRNVKGEKRKRGEESGTSLSPRPSERGKSLLWCQGPEETLTIAEGNFGSWTKKCRVTLVAETDGKKKGVSGRCFVLQESRGNISTSKLSLNDGWEPGARG